jgi:hypothetical protein
MSLSPKGFQSPKFSDSVFREVRGLGHFYVMGCRLILRHRRGSWGRLGRYINCPHLCNCAVILEDASLFL